MPLSRIKVNSVSPTGNVITNLITNEGGQIAFRNKIINGDMSFWQRGTSFSGSTQYTADRYVVNGSTGTVTRDTDVPTGRGFTYSMKQVSSNQAFCFLQPVELVGTGLAGEFYVGSTWTFSFWMKGSGSGSIGLGPEFRNEGISATNAVAAASSTTINYTSTWTKFSYTFTITGTPAGTNTGLSCILYQGSQTGSLWATGFQLEKGSVTTPFEVRPYGTELALCQRYYEVGQIQLVSEGSHYAGYRYLGGAGFRVTKRAAPSASAIFEYAWPNGAGVSTMVVEGVSTTDIRFTDSATMNEIYNILWRVAAEL